MNRIYDLKDVIRLIRDETLLNIDTYDSFLVNGTIEELKLYMNLYLCHKIYDTPYGDMVPLVLSNALGLTLLILSKTAPESRYAVRQIGSGTKNHLLLCILGPRYSRMNTIYDLKDVIRLIRDETLLNIDTYDSFLVNGTIEELKLYMNLYLCHKIYDTPYGDMVPLVLSNALGLTLLILSKTAPESRYEVRQIGSGTKNHLLVYKY